MLDLNTSTRSVAGIEVAADTDDPLHFYYLPPTPTLRKVDGTSQLELLRLQGDGGIKGGHLRFSTHLEQPPQRIEQARQAIEGELRKPVVLAPLPVLEATAELLFAGRETLADGTLTALLRRNLTSAKANSFSPHSSWFSVDLTPNGVRMMESALQSGGAPIAVTYRLIVEGLWPAQRVQATVDYRRAYDHFSSHLKEGFLFGGTDIKRLTEKLREDRVIEIHAVQGLAGDPGNDADIEPALAWIQRDLVERFCEPVMPLDRQAARASLGTIGEIAKLGSDFVLKRREQIELATATVDFQRGLVSRRTYTLQSHLADLLGGVSPAGFITDAGLDHPFFRRLILNVRTSQSLSEVHLSEALLHFAYGNARDSIRLTEATPQGKAEAWADAATDGTWTLAPEVTVAPDAPFETQPFTTLPLLSGRSREVMLDLRELLKLRAFEVRFNPDERVLMTQAKLVHRRGEQILSELDAQFSKDSPVKTLWIRDFQPTDKAEFVVEHLLADGRLVALPPLPADSTLIRLPPAYPGRLTVQVVSEAGWAELERVTVTLRKSDASPACTLVFDQPQQTKVINLDLPDPTDRTFQYRMNRRFESGIEEEDAWMSSDVPFVLAGSTAANRLVVDLAPLGPELSTAGILMIQVELLYLDLDNLVREEKTYVINARSDRYHWDIPIKNPQLKRFEYRTTIHRTSGPPAEVQPWKASTERILPIPIVAA